MPVIPSLGWATFTLLPKPPLPSPCFSGGGHTEQTWCSLDWLLLAIATPGRQGLWIVPTPRLENGPYRQVSAQYTLPKHNREVPWLRREHTSFINRTGTPWGSLKSIWSSPRQWALPPRQETLLPGWTQPAFASLVLLFSFKSITVYVGTPHAGCHQHQAQWRDGELEKKHTLTISTAFRPLLKVPISLSSSVMLLQRATFSNKHVTYMY